MTNLNLIKENHLSLVEAIKKIILMKLIKLEEDSEQYYKQNDT